MCFICEGFVFAVGTRDAAEHGRARTITLVKRFFCTAVSYVGFHLGTLHRALIHATLGLYRLSRWPDGVVGVELYRGQ